MSCLVTQTVYLLSTGATHAQMGEGYENRDYWLQLDEYDDEGTSAIAQPDNWNPTFCINAPMYYLHIGVGCVEVNTLKLYKTLLSNAV